MKKIIGISLSILTLLFGLFAWQYQRFYDNKLHIVFCDVGQGDAILLKTPQNKYILVDGGPDDRVLSCLSSHMPFWSRTIHVMLLTHPHADHLIGFLPVLERYKVDHFVTENIKNTTREFEILSTALQQRKIPTKYVLMNDFVSTADGVILRIVGPSGAFLQKTSPGGFIGERKEFGSLITRIEYGAFRALLTGDSQMEGMKEANAGKVDVFQVPHHGSRFGLDETLVKELSPKVAVISVGKNKYGHPNKRIHEILRNKDIKILRTDEVGDVEIVSDGRQWWVISNR